MAERLSDVVTAVENAAGTLGGAITRAFGGLVTAPTPMSPEEAADARQKNFDYLVEHGVRYINMALEAEDFPRRHWTYAARDLYDAQPLEASDTRLLLDALAMAYTEAGWYTRVRWNALAGWDRFPFIRGDYELTLAELKEWL